MFRKINIGVILICLSIIQLTYSYSSPSSCNSTTKYYDILTLQCTDCPNNKTQVSKFDKTFCNCSSSTYPNWNAVGFSHLNSCLDLNSTYTKNTQILATFDQTGKISPTTINCDLTISYSKFNQNKCVSCGFDPKSLYTTALNACQCNAGYVRIGQACYAIISPWPRKYANSDPFNYLAEQNIKIGCEQQNLHQSCNMLINMCARSFYTSSDYFCGILSTLAISNKSSLYFFSLQIHRPTYKFSSKLTDSIGIYASSIVGTNSSTVKNQLNIISIQYDVYGAIKQVAPIDKDLFQCSITDDDVVKFASFGLNLYKICSNQRTFDRQAYYDFYVQTSEGKYAQIPVLIGGNYYKRISFSVFPGSYKFNLQFISQPPMLVPILSVVSSSSSQISTTSNSSQTALSAIVPLAIINIGIFAVFIIVYYRYLQYNPSDDPNDPYFICKGAVTIVSKMLYTWSYGLWIYLFGLSTYVFCFYKFQQTIYLLVPDQQTQWQSYYFLFVVIYYLCLAIGAISLWTVIYNLSEVDYFLIDWQKQKDTRKFEVGGQRKQVSVWRKVLLVNQLYELAVHHNINIYFVTLFSLLFLKGLQWINLSYSIPNTSNLMDVESTLSQQNVILAYFIITFIFFIISLVQLLIRHVIRIWVPLPAQNFVDLCAVTNISILIFHQYLHGYYIHGMNPLGQSEGNLQYIENMFDKQSKSFGKSRGFRLEDTDACQTFEAIFPIAIRRAFQAKYKAPLMQKMVPKNFQNQSILSNPLPDDLDDNDYEQLQKISLTMIQSFKMYLQTVKSSLQNVQDRSWWTKFISCPISLDQMQFQKAPIFLKDKWNDFTNAFLSGHQFLFLFNFINWVNLFFMATKNIYFASLIAIIMHEILFKLPSIFLMKRNISKNTLIDQKFFN